MFLNLIIVIGVSKQPIFCTCQHNLLSIMIFIATSCTLKALSSLRKQTLDVVIESLVNNLVCIWRSESFICNAKVIAILACHQVIINVVIEFRWLKYLWRMKFLMWTLGQSHYICIQVLLWSLLMKLMMDAALFIWRIKAMRVYCLVMLLTHG